MGADMEFLLLLALPLIGLAFGGSDGDDSDDESAQPGETLSGNDGSDTLIGHAGDDVISGFGGDDSLVGLAGDDVIRGGFGDDTVDGSAGDDTAYGGAGNDVVLGLTGDDSLSGGRGDDVVLGEEDNDSISLGEGNDSNWVDDTVSQSAFDYGQLGDDTVHGDAGNDSIWDYSGTNTLDGGDGNDEISATDNQLDGWETADHTPDQVFGGAGNDLVIGDDGDTLAGGTGTGSGMHVSNAFTSATMQKPSRSAISMAARIVWNLMSMRGLLICPNGRCSHRPTQRQARSQSAWKAMPTPPKPSNWPI